MGSSAKFGFRNLKLTSVHHGWWSLGSLSLRPLIMIAVVLLAAKTEISYAQFGTGFQRAVGGVMVDPQGILRTASRDMREADLKLLREKIEKPQGVFAETAKLRMISLRGLQENLSEAIAEGKTISDELRYLAGLQRIEFVFVYPEQKDIVIAGPAEPWVVRDDSTVVGVKSGRPVIHLEDLIVALRSVETSRTAGLSCSIEPTAEGRERLQNLLRRVSLRPGQDPSSLEPSMKQAFGPQLIKLTGISETSRYARTMVAADYQMKRIGMGLAPSQIEGLPSYIVIARNQRHSGEANPRWWMACNYDALTHDDEKLAWRISGQGVKTLTENNLLGAAGEKNSIEPKTDRSAQAWADMMTARFDQLSTAQPVFGDLRNCLDMSVICTLIVQERLAERAGCDLSLLVSSTSPIELESLPIPKMVDPECSFIRGAAGWVVTASGGVDVNAFEVVQSQNLDNSLAESRSNSKSTSDSGWWWNG